MALTEKQELYISRYREEVRENLKGHLTAPLLEQALSHLHLSILEEILKHAGQQPAEDLQVLQALKELGSPAERAQVLIRLYRAQMSAPESSQRYAAPAARQVPAEQKEAAAAKKEADAEKVVWLGVCLHIARTASLPAWLIRCAAVILGLFGAPLMLIVYMGAFFFFRFQGVLETKEQVHLFRCAGHLFITAFLIILFYCAGKYGLEGIAWAHQYFLKQPLPDLAEWGWLASQQQALLFWALFLLLPPALLSALPVPSGWALSLKRAAQAGVTLYAVLIAFGLASSIAGILLQFYSEFTG